MIESGQEKLSLRAQSAWLLFAKLVAFCLSFVLPLLVVRMLDQSEVGTYRQAFQFIMNALVILPLGFGMSAYYYLSTETSRRASAVLHILLVQAAIGFTVYLALTFFPWILGDIFSNHSLDGLSSLIGAVLCIWLVSTFVEIVAVADGDTRASTLFIILTQLSKTSLMVGSVLVFSTVEAFLVAALIQGTLQSVVLFLYLRSRFPGFWRAFDGPFLVEQMKYALPFGLAGILWTVQTDIHFYFVGRQFSPSEFAVYAYGCFQLPLVWMLAESINSVLIPRMSELAKNEDHAEIKRLLGRATHKLGFVYVPLAVFLGILANTFVVTLFTESYSAATPIFMTNLVLLPFYSFSVDAVTRAFKDLGRRLLILRAVLSVTLIALLAIKGTSFGLQGIIVAVVAVLLTERLVMMFFTARRVGMVRADLSHFFPIVKIAVISILSAVVTLAAKSVIGGNVRSVAHDVFVSASSTDNVLLVEFLTGAAVLGSMGLIFATVYVAGAYYWGLFDRSERILLDKVLSRFGMTFGTNKEKPEVTV